MAQTLRAPYKTGMVLGMGFNSYTQTTCLGNAVTITRTESPETSQIPQDVDYERVFVDKLSEVAQNLNISGSVEIKYGPISGAGSGSYVDTSKFSESDINFLITVRVVNQHSVTDQRVEKFNMLSNVTAANFNSIYGDTYISEMEEGGIFQAVVSMKIVDNSSKEEIKAHANVAFSGVSGSISASGDVEKAKESLNKSTEITISAKWEGGGQIKEAGTAWSIDELIAVGARFPELCAKVPQTSFVVLKKYVHLASFHEQVKDISPLSYENAAIYTDLLMDNFLDYKMMLKQVNNTIEGLRKKTLEFDPTAGPPEVDDAFRPTVSAMVDARGDILLQCSAINQLVDDITAKPDVILTFNTAHRPPYMDATRWQLRLPPTRPVKVAPPVSVLDNRIVLRGRPAILAASDNTHDVFAQGTDGFLWHKATAPGQPRGDWLYQGDNVPLSSECSPCAAAVGQQRKYCFVVGADSRLYYKTIGAAADAKWTALAEPPTAKGIRFRGGLAAISRLAGDGDDAVVVVAVGADARPYWALVSGADGATWTAFAPLRGASLRATPPVLVRNGGAAGALVLVAVDADHRLVANVLPGGGAPAWTGWTANAASYVSGDEVAASWPLPVDQDWATQIDVLALGESRRRSYEFQLVHGAWRDAIADFGRDWLRSAVGFASLAPGRQEYFAVAGGGADGKDLAGALWQTSWNLSKSTQPAASWHRVADGPFRATMPVVVPISDDDVAVYVVTAEGKLIRLVTSAGSVAEVERV